MSLAGLAVRGLCGGCVRPTHRGLVGQHGLRAGRPGAGLARPPASSPCLDAPFRSQLVARNTSAEVPTSTKQPPRIPGRCTSDWLKNSRDFKALRAPPWSGPEPDQVDDNVQMITASGYRKYFFHVVLCLTAWSWSVHSGAQTSSPSKAQAGLALPSGASAKKVDEFLATLRPPTSIQALESGNDLLLDLPDIAAAGPVRVNAISTMPGTDGMWLLSLSPQPESGAALFAAVTLAPASLPDTTFLLNLTKTQPILLIARAGGKYYGLQREIKIGIPTLNVKKN